jgi:hypothetical protein
MHMTLRDASPFSSPAFTMLGSGPDPFCLPSDTAMSMGVHLTLAVSALAIGLAACAPGNISPTYRGDAGFDVAAEGRGISGLGGNGIGTSGTGGSAGNGIGASGTGGSAGNGIGTSGTGGTVATGTSPAGELLLDIAGTTQGIDYAFLKVAGKATLGGEVHLTFASGFVPKSGQTFIVVTAAGGISGAFASITTNGVAVTSGQDATTFYVTVN